MPNFPAAERRLVVVDEERQRRLVGPVLFKSVEVLEEQEPGCLLGVIELRRAAGLFAQRVVDVAEGLLKHVEEYPVQDTDPMIPSAGGHNPVARPSGRNQEGSSSQ